MKTYQTNRLNPLDLQKLDPQEVLWLYNGLDCCITIEVFEEIKSNRTEHSTRLYEFNKSLQAPAMEMMLRGTKISFSRRAELEDKIKADVDRVYAIFDEFCLAICNCTFNPLSHKQMPILLYDIMKFPEIKKKGKRTTERNALEKLQAYMHAQPIVNCIMKIRELRKKLSVVRTAIDRDGRFRTTYSVAGTETGRWSSSENAFGTGSNDQNITDELRVMFIADPGYKMAYIDLEQAESRHVAYLSNDENYIKACESGDLHTEVCKLIWPELPWGSDTDRKIADRLFYRHFSYRDMAKRGGHASNYNATAWTLSQNLKIPREVAETFLFLYFQAFPGIRKWHTSIAKALVVDGHLDTVFDWRRKFFSRAGDDTTLREAIAFGPQSGVGMTLNYGMHEIWRNHPQAQLLKQVHDAVLVQYPEELEPEILPKLIKELEIELEFSGVKMTVPAEATVGWNWGHYANQEDVDAKRAERINLDGLKKWKGNDSRERQETPTVELVI